jgi:hypothetical protein
VQTDWYDTTQASYFNTTVYCYYSSYKWYIRIVAKGIPSTRVLMARMLVDCAVLSDHPYSTPDTVEVKSYDKLVQLNQTLDLDKAYQNPYDTSLYGAVGIMIDGVVFFTPLSAEGVDAINPPSGTIFFACTC